MLLADMQQIAVMQAHKAGIDPALVKAVCSHESSWYPWAVRYEPAFFDRYIAGMKGLTATEMHNRSTSFGLMQIMGQTAREQGCRVQSLAELCDPMSGIEQGCIKLARCLKDHPGDVNAALLEYNGGSDLSYPNAVMAFYKV